jgi:hypothetical protein
LSDVDHNNAVRRITLALKGPVADVYRGLIPAFRELKGDAFYDSVLASSDMLHGCILIFRKCRDSFSHLLVDNDGRLVADDFVRLRCGRSVHDIIAMIVRTHGKRHFRQELGGDSNDPKSKSGKLYQAMNEYLIHEWQVPLIPHYAPLPADKMLELGPALLEMKTIAEVDDLVTRLGGTPIVNGKSIPMPQPKISAGAEAAPKPPAEPIMVETRSREADFWWETLNDHQVRAALGSLTDAERRELTAAFSSTCEAVRTDILAPLGLSLFQAAVLLTKIYQVMGRAGFAQMFGKPGNPKGVADFGAKLKAKGVNSRTDLRSLGKTAEAVLGQTPRPSSAPRPAADPALRH